MVTHYQNTLFILSEDLKVKKTPKTRSKTKKKKKFALPWWCKIIAYILSFIFSAVSLVFIIIRGISFGDATVQKWLTSIVFSLLSSIFLTQPIHVNIKSFAVCIILNNYFCSCFLKVAVVTFVIVLIFRPIDDDSGEYADIDDKFPAENFKPNELNEYVTLNYLKLCLPVHILKYCIHVCFRKV
jgi:hypothetical protein